VLPGETNAAAASAIERFTTADMRLFCAKVGSPRK